MAIDYVVDYEKNPPKGAEKLFFSTMEGVLIVAIMSLAFVAPLLFIREGTLKGDRLLPIDFIIGLNTGVLAGMLALAVLSILACTFVGSRSKKDSTNPPFLSSRYLSILIPRILLRLAATKQLGFLPL